MFKKKSLYPSYVRKYFSSKSKGENRENENERRRRQIHKGMLKVSNGLCLDEKYAAQLSV